MRTTSIDPASGLTPRDSNVSADSAQDYQSLIEAACGIPTGVLEHRNCFLAVADCFLGRFAELSGPSCSSSSLSTFASRSFLRSASSTPRVFVSTALRAFLDISFLPLR